MIFKYSLNFSSKTSSDLREKFIILGYVIWWFSLEFVTRIILPYFVLIDSISVRGTSCIGQRLDKINAIVITIWKDLLIIKLLMILNFTSFHCNTHLCIQMACIFVEVPHIAIIAVRQPEASDPLFATVTTTLGDHSGDEGRGPNIKLQPFICW